MNEYANFIKEKLDTVYILCIKYNIEYASLFFIILRR